MREVRLKELREKVARLNTVAQDNNGVGMYSWWVAMDRLVTEVTDCWQGKDAK